jgi:hypothetical protein
MATKSFLPTTDRGLLDWAQNFSNRITATPGDFGLTVPQAAAFAALFTTSETAYGVVADPGTKTKGAVAAKNTARTALKVDARNLASIVQGIATVTDQQKIDLGLTVRDREPTPIPPPEVAPDMDIISVLGRTVRIRLHNEKVLKRRKPEGVKGAAVFSFVGPTPPEQLDAWKFEGNTTQTTIDVEFPSEVPAGSLVWLTAFWCNPRLQSGPPCQPNSVYLAGGLAAAA